MNGDISKIKIILILINVDLCHFVMIDCCLHIFLLYSSLLTFSFSSFIDVFVFIKTLAKVREMLFFRYLKNIRDLRSFLPLQEVLAT